MSSERKSVIQQKISKHKLKKLHELFTKSECIKPSVHVSNKHIRRVSKATVIALLTFSPATLNIVPWSITDSKTNTTQRMCRRCRKDSMNCRSPSSGQRTATNIWSWPTRTCWRALTTAKTTINICLTWHSAKRINKRRRKWAIEVGHLDNIQTLAKSSLYAKIDIVALSRSCTMCMKSCSCLNSKGKCFSYL